ncbi:MAG: hypothetical protein Q7S06_01485 [Nanoarchaeota archaeon]|nr:hypothetical protein [Nanoarchaeota archaeon]
MVQLEIEVTSLKTIKKVINPIGNSRTAWLIKETLSRDYEQDVCHDGGWEVEDSWTYILPSKELLDNKLAKILEERKKDGWCLDSESPHYSKLYMRIGSAPLLLEYNFGEEQIVE